MTLKLVMCFDGLPRAGTVPTAWHLFFSPQTNPLRQEWYRVGIQAVETEVLRAGQICSESWSWDVNGRLIPKCPQPPSLLCLLAFDWLCCGVTLVCSWTKASLARGLSSCFCYSRKLHSGVGQTEGPIPTCATLHKAASVMLLPLASLVGWNVPR